MACRRCPHAGRHLPTGPHPNGWAIPHRGTVDLMSPPSPIALRLGALYRFNDSKSITFLDRPCLDNVSNNLPLLPPASTNPCHCIMINSNDSVRLMNIIMTMNMCIAFRFASFFFDDVRGVNLVLQL